MNNCIFIGRMIGDPDLEKVDDVSYLSFSLEIEETKNKKRIVQLLPFEAWHTGAEAIAKHCKADDYIVVQASAKDDVHGVVFRVNSFKIFGYEIEE